MTSLGILSGAPLPQPHSGLGVVNYWCWDHPGFKSCAATQDTQANQECREDFARGQNGGFTSIANCYQTKAERYIIANCSCPKTDPNKKAPAVTSSSSSIMPSLTPPTEPETKILGLPLKTVGIIAIGAYAVYELVLKKEKG